MAARIRHTRQLDAIRRAFSAARPLSIAEIHRTARKHEPRLGMATVYRTVKALIEQGVIVLIELPGEPPRFEVAGKGHHHYFQCRRCARVFETKACVGDLRRLVPRQFHITGHDIVLYGQCGECASHRHPRGC